MSGRGKVRAGAALNNTSLTILIDVGSSAMTTPTKGQGMPYNGFFLGFSSRSMVSNRKGLTSLIIVNNPRNILA